MKRQMIITPKTTKENLEKAILVTVEEAGKEAWKVEERAEELKCLAESCYVEIVNNQILRRKTLTPDLFIGKGKVQEIASLVEKLGADVVIFNNDLSASQQKNLEEAFNAKTIDRTQLILDIFARRATSAEGKVQVELAQLIYLLPRLSRMWLHLSRQRGGVGTKGPGEQQLEVDRRRVRQRITRLKRTLREITRQRELRRAQREKFSMLTIALVGYTNSGKSTLFNALTSAKVKVKDQLFSTLDPTIRKMSLLNNQTVLLSDTVGFLNELPHHLVESFKATLEEVIDADILFNIVDMSDPRMEGQKVSVFKVLEELGVADKPIFTILNKSDKIPDSLEIERIKRKFHRPIVISALKRTGLSEVEDRIVQFLQKDMEDIELILPHKHYDLAKIVREKGQVKKEEYRDKGLFISARVPKKIKYSIFKKLKDRSK